MISPLLLLLIFLLPFSQSNTLVFLGPSQAILSLPSFSHSPCIVPPHPVGHGLNCAVAGYVSEQLLVCGGYDGQWTHLSSCHALVDKEWREMASLSTQRCSAAGSLNDGGE